MQNQYWQVIQCVCVCVCRLARPGLCTTSVTCFTPRESSSCGDVLRSRETCRVTWETRYREPPLSTSENTSFIAYVLSILTPDLHLTSHSLFHTLVSFSSCFRTSFSCVWCWKVSGMIRAECVYRRSSRTHTDTTGGGKKKRSINTT